MYIVSCITDTCNCKKEKYLTSIFPVISSSFLQKIKLVIRASEVVENNKILITFSYFCKISK